jgi:NADH-quinone oxidoreductase subunit M
LLRAVLNVTFGQIGEGHAEKLFDMKLIEAVPVVILLGLIIGIGVYPSILATPLAATLELIMLGIGG